MRERLICLSRALRRSRSPGPEPLVFAASLLWFFYCYASGSTAWRGPLTTGGAAPRGDRDRRALFSVFAAPPQPARARERRRRGFNGSSPPELERSIYTWIASLLFIAVCTLVAAASRHALSLDWRGAARRLARCSSPASRSPYARRGMLDVLDLSGVRAGCSGRQQATRALPLKVTGLYGFVRHPLYFAWAVDGLRRAGHDRDAASCSPSSAPAIWRWRFPGKNAA